MYLLEAMALRKTYDGIIALNNGNLCCEEGKVCGLLGANGSGKSTFSKIVSGIIRPCGGELLLNGKKVVLKSTLDAKRLGIAMIHQNLSLVPELTVWENINLGHESETFGGFVDNNKAIKTAEIYMEKVCPGISVFEKVVNLAPAQKQLVEIAKALSQKPRILIMDEPTAALEQTQVERLFSIIKELKEDKVAIIFISHRLWEVTKICDFVVVFRDGNTVGTIDLSEKEKDERKIISMITGKDGISCNYYERKRELNFENMLEIDDLSVSGKVHNTKISIKKGEIVGLGGLQGQGQEELLLALSGLLPSTGDIKIQGNKVKLKHPRDAIRNGMMLVPGDRHKEGLFLKHDMFSNLIYTKFSLKKHGRILGFKDLLKESSEIIKSLSVNPPDSKKTVKYLSGGNQQKVVVGKWINLAPQILLLSDPAKGVDIEAKHELYKVISKLAEKGTSVLLYASDNEELICLCDRVLVMFEGKIVDDIPMSELSEERIVASSMRTEYLEDVENIKKADVKVGGDTTK